MGCEHGRNLAKYFFCEREKSIIAEIINASISFCVFFIKERTEKQKKHRLEPNSIVFRLLVSTFIMQIE